MNYFRGIVHPRMKILSSFTHPQVVPNLYEFLCSAEHKGRYLIEIISSLVQFMTLSNKLIISIRCVKKGDMQNVQSRGSPGLELRTTGLKGCSKTNVTHALKIQKIEQPWNPYSGLQAWFSSNMCENKCISLNNFRTLHHHTTLIFSTCVSREAAANEHEDSL